MNGGEVGRVVLATFSSDKSNSQGENAGARKVDMQAVDSRNPASILYCVVTSGDTRESTTSKLPDSSSTATL